MPILDIQTRLRELGRIRIGQVVPTNNGRTRPEKMDRFRLTSHSRPLLEKVAALYGGTVQAWAPQGGGASAWEVVTTADRLPIMVPPQPVSQWYETWSAGGCTHRCDGETDYITGEACDGDNPQHQQSKPTTRLNVVLREIPGVGVWRLESHGWNAAVELPQAAAFLAEHGGYVEGWLALEPRVSKADGKTRNFMVPIIEIDVTPGELMAGRGRVQPAALDTPTQAAPPQAPQLEAPRPQVDYDAALRRLLATDSTADFTAVWHQLVEERIVGQNAPPVPEPFMVAAKGHGAAVKAIDQAEQPPTAPEPQPDADGAYPVEVIEQQPTPAAPTGDPAMDPDVLWAKILKAANDGPGWTLTELSADFRSSVGCIPDEATGAEMAAYLQRLLTGEAGA